MPQYYVYVLHTERPLADHASHYVGATDNLLRRLIEHATGRGARITRAFLEAGIEWRLATVFVMNHKTQYLAERRIKKYHGSHRFCACCCGEDFRSVDGADSIDVETLGIPLTSAELRVYKKKETA